MCENDKFADVFSLAGICHDAGCRRSAGAFNEGDDVAMGQTSARDDLFKRRSTFDARAFDPKLTATSAGEKAAVATMRAWVAKNLGGLGYAPDDVQLTGYVLHWGGKPGAHPFLTLVVQPDSLLSQAAWGN